MTLSENARIELSKKYETRYKGYYDKERLRRIIAKEEFRRNHLIAAAEKLLGPSKARLIARADKKILKIRIVEARLAQLEGGQNTK